MGLVAPRHLGSSQTRAQTHVPCIGRPILNHWATSEALCVYFCFVWFVHLFLFYNIPHMNEIIQYLSFSIWLISLSVISLWSIHVVVNGKIPSFFMAEYYSPVYHIFFIHSSISGHLWCFHILAIVNNAAINIQVHDSFLIIDFVFFW